MGRPHVVIVGCPSSETIRHVKRLAPDTRLAARIGSIVEATHISEAPLKTRTVTSSVWEFGKKSGDVSLFINCDSYIAKHRLAIGA